MMNDEFETVRMFRGNGGLGPRMKITRVKPPRNRDGALTAPLALQGQGQDEEPNNHNRENNRENDDQDIAMQDEYEHQADGEVVQEVPVEQDIAMQDEVENQADGEVVQEVQEVEAVQVEQDNALQDENEDKGDDNQAEEKSNETEDAGSVKNGCLCHGCLGRQACCLALYIRDRPRRREEYKNIELDEDPCELHEVPPKWDENQIQDGNDASALNEANIAATIAAEVRDQDNLMQGNEEKFPMKFLAHWNRRYGPNRNRYTLIHDGGFVIHEPRCMIEAREETDVELGELGDLLEEGGNDTEDDSEEEGNDSEDDSEEGSDTEDDSEDDSEEEGNDTEEEGSDTEDDSEEGSKDTADHDDTQKQPNDNSTTTTWDPCLQYELELESAVEHPDASVCSDQMTEDEWILRRIYDHLCFKLELIQRYVRAKKEPKLYTTRITIKDMYEIKRYLFHLICVARFVRKDWPAAWTISYQPLATHKLSPMAWRWVDVAKSTYINFRDEAYEKDARDTMLRNRNKDDAGVRVWIPDDIPTLDSWDWNRDRQQYPKLPQTIYLRAQDNPEIPNSIYVGERYRLSKFLRLQPAPKIMSSKIKCPIEKEQRHWRVQRQLEDEHQLEDERKLQKQRQLQKQRWWERKRTEGTTSLLLEPTNCPRKVYLKQNFDPDEAKIWLSKKFPDKVCQQLLSSLKEWMEVEHPDKELNAVFPLYGKLGLITFMSSGDEEFNEDRIHRGLYITKDDHGELCMHFIALSHYMVHANFTAYGSFSNEDPKPRMIVPKICLWGRRMGKFDFGRAIEVPFKVTECLKSHLKSENYRQALWSNLTFYDGNCLDYKDPYFEMETSAWEERPFLHRVDMEHFLHDISSLGGIGFDLAMQYFGLVEKTFGVKLSLDRHDGTVSELPAACPASVKNNRTNQEDGKPHAVAPIQAIAKDKEPQHSLDPVDHDKDNDGTPVAMAVDEDDDGKPNAADDGDNDGTPRAMDHEDNDGKPHDMPGDEDDDGKPHAKADDGDNDGQQTTRQPHASRNAEVEDDLNHGKPHAQADDGDNDGQQPTSQPHSSRNANVEDQSLREYERRQARVQRNAQHQFEEQGHAQLEEEHRLEEQPNAPLEEQRQLEEEPNAQLEEQRIAQLQEQRIAQLQEQSIAQLEHGLQDGNPSRLNGDGEQGRDNDNTIPEQQVQGKNSDDANVDDDYSNEADHDDSKAAKRSHVDNDSSGSAKRRRVDTFASNEPVEDNKPSSVEKHGINHNNNKGDQTGKPLPQADDTLAPDKLVKHAKPAPIAKPAPVAKHGINQNNNISEADPSNQTGKRLEQRLAKRHCVDVPLEDAKPAPLANHGINHNNNSKAEHFNQTGKPLAQGAPQNMPVAARPLQHDVDTSRKVHNNVPVNKKGTTRKATPRPEFHQYCNSHAPGDAHVEGQSGPSNHSTEDASHGQNQRGGVEESPAKARGVPARNSFGSQALVLAPPLSSRYGEDSWPIFIINPDGEGIPFPSEDAEDVPKVCVKVEEDGTKIEKRICLRKMCGVKCKGYSCCDNLVLEYVHIKALTLAEKQAFIAFHKRHSRKISIFNDFVKDLLYAPEDKTWVGKVHFPTCIESPVDANPNAAMMEEQRHGVVEQQHCDTDMKSHGNAPPVLEQQRCNTDMKTHANAPPVVEQQRCNTDMKSRGPVVTQQHCDTDIHAHANSAPVVEYQRYCDTDMKAYGPVVELQHCDIDMTAHGNAPPIVEQQRSAAPVAQQRSLSAVAEEPPVQAAAAPDQATEVSVPRPARTQIYKLFALNTKVRELPYADAPRVQTEGGEFVPICLKKASHHCSKNKTCRHIHLRIHDIETLSSTEKQSFLSFQERHRGKLDFYSDEIYDLFRAPEHENFVHTFPCRTGKFYAEEETKKKTAADGTLPE